MTTKVHTDFFVNGLSIADAVSLSYSICQGEPLSRDDANNLLGSGGNRVSLVESSSAAFVEDGTAPDSKQLVIPSIEFNSTVQVPVSAGTADLWIAVFDGTRLLIVSNDFTDQELVADATIVTPSLSYVLGQAA